MPAHNKNTSRLHASTDDPGVASTHAVARPRAGDRPLMWYRDTKPRFYRPYLIRVLKLDDTTMEFVFLNSRSGDDLALSRPTYEISYHDGRYAYSALPSTAPKARPGTAQSCGLLFISDLYMQALPDADRETIIGTGAGDDKYPYSAGRFSTLIKRLQSELGEGLSSEDKEEVASMLELLQAVS